ncbi:class I SAM-dependent methyltransferase [Slackia heliotrinireducens]|uniref:class I SAM-dependent methyltransferase n=1 Tax=Slackia heliotrinireducens TaxID=84110 RepID=UPI0033146E61
MPDVELHREPEGLTLVGDGMSLRGDFTRLLPRLKPGTVQRELLVKAAKVKGVDAPVAVDATAGLGEDSLLLAAAGFTVYMYERDEVIFALLEDALDRAAQVPQLAEIVRRMHLTQGDSVQALAHLDFLPDVVVLDPMFPMRQKSAVSKKKMQLFQMLEAPCTDEEALLQAAIDANPRKIVVKRPPKGPYLAGRKPSHSVAGKAVRFDVISLPRM